MKKERKDVPIWMQSSKEKQREIRKRPRLVWGRELRLPLELLRVSHAPRQAVCGHGLQPSRLLRPWDFPGKSTGVGCHCLLSDTLFPLGSHKPRWLTLLHTSAPSHEGQCHCTPPQLAHSRHLLKNESGDRQGQWEGQQILWVLND